jgi:hypothetical protein
MSHQNLEPSALENPVQRMDKTQIMIITIAGNTHQRLERSDLRSQVKPPAEVSGVPDLIHRLQKSLELIAENPVRIRYKTYIHPIVL